MDNLEYIYTKNGPIYKYDIPLVVNEGLEEKVHKAGLFFIISLVIFIIILYIAKTEIDSRRVIILNRDILEDNAKCTPSAVQMDGLIIYDKDDSVDFLENIILIDNEHDNAFDINFVALKGYYSVDLPKYHNIKEIILISNKKNYINLVLYKDQKAVWNYSGYIDKKENSIIVTKKHINNY